MALIKKIFFKKIKSNAAKFVKLDLTPNLSSNGLHVGLYFLKNINRVNNMQSTSTIYIYIYIYIYIRNVVWEALESGHYGGWKNRVLKFFRNKLISTYFLPKILRKHSRNLVKPVHGPQKC